MTKNKQARDVVYGALMGKLSAEEYLVLDAVGSLPELPRKVVTLRKVYGYDIRRIAIELNVTEAQVEGALGEGMIGLAQAFDTQESEESIPESKDL